MMNDWAMQVAWMQAWMQASSPQYAGEDADYAEQDLGFFVEIDIKAELLKVISQGLGAVHKATQAADCLRRQLANVKRALEYFWNVTSMQFFIYYPGGDDLEVRAARALREVDELLRQQAAKESPPVPRAAVDDLRLLQRYSQDVALLACSRGIDQKALQSKGIPPELLGRLEAAFGQADLQDDSLWSRLGNSKYHVFTQGLRFGERKHKHGRGGRKSRRSQTDAAEDEASAEGGDPVANSSAASSDLLAGATAAPARVTTTSAASSSWEGVGEPMHLPMPWPLSKEATELVRSLKARSWKKADAAAAASPRATKALGEPMSVQMSVHMPERAPEVRTGAGAHMRGRCAGLISKRLDPVDD